VPGVRVEVVDTVGAGDTFQAALLTGLARTRRLSAQAAGQLNSEQLERLIGFAAACAAITCSRRGADLPRRNEVTLPELDH
jgi:fructokinase